MRHKIHGYDVYTMIAPDNKTKATVVPDRGAWIASLILPFQSGAREVLFQHDYAWNKEINDLLGGLPFLFPVCARLSRQNKIGCYLYDGKLYELKIHGFSWYEKWEVVSVLENSIELILRDNINTRLRYPFQFEVRLLFAVSAGKLSCRQIYKNCEKSRAMPYYAGFHPYFLTPRMNAGKEKVVLNFYPARRLKYNDTLTDIIGEQPVLKMPANITDPALNEQLFILGEEKLATLIFANGDVLKINAQGVQDPDIFSYLQLYTIPEKPFFCVEHWMSFPNALNTVYGVRWLNAGESEEAVFEISQPVSAGV